LTRKGVKGSTPRQKSARARNLAKGREKHRKPNETNAQLAQRRAALVHARAAQRLMVHKTTSPALVAVEKKYEAAGEKAWIAKGEAAWLRGEAVYIARGREAYQSYYHAHTLSQQGAMPFRRSLKAPLRHPLGTREISFALKRTLAVKKPTGINKKFVKEIAPTGYGTPTAWHKARKHHYHARIHVRKQRRMPLGKWRRRKKRIIAR
jgi:hypothetical protein